jgi:hypothetical protein
MKPLQFVFLACVALILIGCGAGHPKNRIRVMSLSLVLVCARGTVRPCTILNTKCHGCALGVRSQNSLTCSAP